MPPEHMNVLITVNSAWNVLNFRREIIDTLLTRGHRVTILAPSDDSVAELEKMGCHFVHLEMNVKGLNPIQDAKLLYSYINFFKSLKPEIILSYTIKNNIFGALAAQTSGIPFIPNVTGLGTAFLSGGILQLVAVSLLKFAFGKSPIVFLQNEDDRKLFISKNIVKPAQSRLLPGSGINLLEFSPQESEQPNDKIVFLMIARLIKDKGIFEYVEASKIVKKVCPEVSFQVLGPLVSDNRSAITSSTLQDWQKHEFIEYLGHQNDVRPFIAKADVVVLPSYREGAPRTLIESAAMGKPLIATNVPGCRSVVKHNESGLICEARSAESLAAACLELIQMTDQDRLTMGLAGRRFMETNYDHKMVVAMYLKAIEELTSSRT